jgi:hypothetical protein
MFTIAGVHVVGLADCSALTTQIQGPRMLLLRCTRVRPGTHTSNRTRVRPRPTHQIGGHAYVRNTCMRVQHGARTRGDLARQGIGVWRWGGMHTRTHARTSAL